MANVNHIVKTNTQYVVKLPFNSSPSQKGYTRQSDFHRIKYVTHALAYNLQKNKQYMQFMK